MKFEFWNEVEDSFLLNQIFSDYIKIGYVNLFSVDVIRDGPTVRLHFDLADSLPDRPLPHWGKPNIDYNRGRMGADCFGVSKFSMQGISTRMVRSRAYLLLIVMDTGRALPMMPWDVA